MAKKSPDKHDVEIGKHVKAWRVKRGMSQEVLGKACTPPITFQQIQKYEHGTNRIGGSRMAQIAKALKVPVAVLHGEDGLGNKVDHIDSDVTTASRRRLINALIVINDSRIEAAFADLAERFALTRKKPATGGRHGSTT